MEERELLRELDSLRNAPTTTEDWRDLYETIEAYKRRCLARAIAAAPNRVELLAAIRARASA